jgi:hypothetical protein
VTFEATAPLTITLDDVEPPVLRRIVAPLSIRMDRLHLTIQAAMEWTNTHLWEFRARDIGWGIPNPDYGCDNPIDARKTKLIQAIQETGAKTIKYIYDFGDCWEHTIKVGRVRDMPIGLDYPFLLDAYGRRPPEDIGGPEAYAHFLSSPDGADFNPGLIDKPRIEAALDALAQKWRRRPPKPKRIARP